MRFKLEIDMDNAVFENSPGTEVSRMLQDVAKHVKREGTDFARRLSDSNGNVVGYAKVVKGRRKCGTR